MPFASGGGDCWAWAALAASTTPMPQPAIRLKTATISRTAKFRHLGYRRRHISITPHLQQIREGSGKFGFIFPQ
jgi:hypothetical protein